MRSLAVILCGASILPAPADDLPSVDNLINEWRFQCRQMQSIAGNVQLASFDDDLHIQRNASGRFRFASVEEKFWTVTPLDELPDSRRKRLRTGIPYRYERYKPTHCRWSAGLVYKINDPKKEFVVSRMSPTGGPLLAQFNIGDCHTPFLPGLPGDTPSLSGNSLLLGKQVTMST